MTESTPAAQPTTPNPPRPDTTQQDVEADIAANRERLGESVEDLVDKFNIPGRAKQRAQQATGQAKQATASLVDRLKDLPPKALLASFGGLAALIGFVIIKKRRR